MAVAVTSMFCLIPGATVPERAAAGGAEGQPQGSRPTAPRPVGASGQEVGLTAVARSETCRSARKGLSYYESRQAYWRKRMGAGRDLGRTDDPLRVGALAVPRQSCPHVRSLARLWRSRAHRARLRYERWARERAHRFRSLYEKWRCIHEHEGAWDSNTGNGYWGGLQMDWGFMHTYGPEFTRRWGTADRWPVWAQLTAAERAFHGFAGYAGRGFAPWGTRGMCGV